MKKIFVMAITALAFTACSNQKDSDTVETKDTVATTSSTSSDNYTTTNAYVPAEGDVSYRNGKLMVWKNGNYVEAEDDVVLEGNVTVRRNGEVVREGKTVKLEDGESVNRTGNFFNKAGEAIDDAWDATKKGVKKAGKEVGEAVESVVD